jgi:membrane protein implicated in regulation of membrane protease activity
MRKTELVTLSLLLFGLFIFSLGSILYLRKVMLEYAVEWELQLAIFGLLSILFALIVSKILAKVELNE